MFNDKYGLTQAVLDGRKTMTRRIIKCPSNAFGFRVMRNGVGDWFVEAYDDDERPIGYIEPTYKVGEVVAIAQNYKDAGWDANTLQEAYVKTPTIFPDLDEYEKMSGIIDLPFKYHKGWNNKMFVKADLMPHAIEITDIKVEQLKDISEDNCLREGIDKCGICYEYIKKRIEGKYHFRDCGYCFKTPREAFAALIDRISGKGTWESNPWVFVYEFKLIK